MEITIICRACRKLKTITVDEEGYLLWKSGKALIQEALPNVIPEDRELLISHICGRCWNKLLEERN